MAPEPKPEGRPRQAALFATGSTGAAGFAASLLVLGGVFYFINSACSSGTSDPPPGCAASTVVPTGSSIAITLPADGANIVGDAKDGRVTVQVELAATGVKVLSQLQCVDGAGHFEVSVLPVDPPDCGPSNRYDHADLIDGSNSVTLALVPGAYILAANITGGLGRPFDAALTAMAHIVVTDAHADAGAKRCP